MQGHVRSGSVTARSLRAGLPSRLRASAVGSSRTGSDSRRRGSLITVPALWRRCDMGTNHIASFGVWRRGTRRQAERRNRAGLTRWHMPYQGGVKIHLSGADREAVNED